MRALAHTYIMLILSGVSFFCSLFLCFFVLLLKRIVDLKFFWPLYLSKSLFTFVLGSIISTHSVAVVVVAIMQYNTRLDYNQIIQKLREAFSSLVLFQ